VAPSRNVTVPVGVPPDDVTVAVKVTDWPDVDGLMELANAVEVLALTTWLTAPDVLVARFVVPPYEAVIECVPTDRVDVDRVATPELSVPVPIELAPSRKVTVPVGVPAADVTVAVNVTD
jgi:hypothetical protein